MGLTPDVVVRQIFRTPAPALVPSAMPAVLVGIQREFGYRKNAGTYLGGQANSYDFPDLTASSAVEPLTHADTFLRPHVYISNEYGVAEVTADVTFANLDTSAVAPSFEIATDAEATFEVASGTAGDFSATTGSFVDPSADFIAGRVGADDIIKLDGVPAFIVESLVSDDEVTVTRVNHGPTDARVGIGPKNSQGARTITYRGTLGNGFNGFVSEGARVGDAVALDAWSEKTATLGLAYTATAGERRTLTVGGTQFTNAAIGDVVLVRDDENVLEPAFIITAHTGASSRPAANIRGTLADADIAGSTGYPAKYFETKRVTTLRGSKRFTGFFTEQNQAGERTFSDVNGAFVVDGVADGDWIVVYAADSGALTNIAITSTTITRGSGSWLTDGFAAGMKILIVSSEDAGNKIEATIDTVTSSVITVTASVLTVNANDGSFRVVSADMTPLFEVSGSPPSATTLTVTDLTRGALAAAAVGGPLMYSIYSAAAVSGAAASGANVSAAGTIQTTAKRFVAWPVGFTAGTLPAADDYVFNDDGVLLFNVVTAAKVAAVTDVASFAFNATSDTIIRASGSWVTAGFAVGDYIQVIGSENTGENDFTYKIASITTTSVTNDTITVATAGGSAATPTYRDGIAATNATDTTATVQKLVVENHETPGFAVPAGDVISGIYLSIRAPDSAPYEIVRVNSETSITVRHEVSGDEVADTNVLGAVITVTVPDTVEDEAYTIEKTVTGAALVGDVLVTYAARRTDRLGELVTVQQGAVEDLAGPAVPGNPLGFAAAAAAQAAAVPIYVVQVEADTADAWSAAIATVSNDTVYNLAPLTQDEARLAAFQTHVTLFSQPLEKSERVLWQSHRFENSVTRYTLDVADDSALIKYPSTAQTIEVTHAGGVVALGVIVGDIVTATYSGYVPSLGYTSGTIEARIAAIAEVGDLTTLTLVADTTMPATLSAGVSLTALVINSRTYTTAALLSAIEAYPGTIQSPRVRNVYADRVLVTFSDTTNPSDPTVGIYGGGDVSDYEVGGWLPAAIIAALRSSLPPSTPLGKRPMSGVQRLVSPFRSRSEIDRIVDAGHTVLQQPGGDNAAISCIRGITTDVRSLNALEEIVTIQVDSLARRLRTQFGPMMGAMPLSQAFYDVLSMNTGAVISSAVRDEEIKSADLVSISEDPNRADTVLMSLDVTVFYTNAHLDVTVYI